LTEIDSLKNIEFLLQEILTAFKEREKSANAMERFCKDFMEEQAKATDKFLHGQVKPGEK